MTRLHWRTMMFAGLAVALSACAYAQDQPAEVPSQEYVLIAELEYGQGGQPVPILSAGGRLGAKAEDVAMLEGLGGTQGGGENMAAGFNITVAQLTHDPWRHLVIFAKSDMWTGTFREGAAESDELAFNKTIEVEGSGTYSLRPDTRLKVLDLDYTAPGGAKRSLRLFVTARMAPPATKQ